MQLNTVLVAAKPAQEAQEGSSDLVMASAAMRTCAQVAAYSASVATYSGQLNVFCARFSLIVRAAR